jgi:hypothetical protein
VLIGVIRPTESRDLEAAGESLEAIANAFHAQVPEGWQLLHQRVTMPKGSSALTATGRMARWGELQEIQAPDLDALQAAVPEGWQLMSVRRAD